MEQASERMREIFNGANPDEHLDRWNSVWEKADCLPFDRASCNPAIIDLLLHRDRPCASPDPNPTPSAPSPNSTSLGYSALPPPIREDGKRRRALVPACGRGYDVALFAAHGYDAYGLEVSRHAADAARKWLENPGEGPLEGEYRIAQQEGKIKGGGWGKMTVLCGDFFDEEWTKEVDGWEEDGGGFDVIMDYTFLCVLPFELKPKWAKHQSSLLRRHDTKADPNSETRPNDGMLICIEFPTSKPLAQGGPPWALPPITYVELLKRPGEDITYNENGEVVATDRPEADDALVKIAHYTPRRTHEVAKVDGVVRDCVSIWRPKSDVAERQRWH